MKKILSLMLTIILALSVFALVACTNPCTEHVDANHDGKCDKCSTTVDVNHVDEDNNGKCDVCQADIPGWTAPNTKEVLSATSILDGIWESPVYGDATHVLQDYTAFHDNGIFYHRMQGDRTPDAGNYTYSAAAANATMQISPSDGEPYTINVEAWVTLTTFKGEAYKSSGDSFQDGKYPIAYDEAEEAYVLYGMHYGDMRYVHKRDVTHTWNDETAITVDKFVDSANELNSVEIGHNGQFTDMATGTYYEGTWTYNATNKTYTLTGTDGTATLKITENNAYGEYKRGTTEITLDNVNFKAEAILKFEGSLAMAGGASCELIVYNNNKYDLYVAGNLNANGSGTWTKDGENYVFASTAVNATTTITNGKYSVEVMGSTLNEVVPAKELLTLNGNFDINGNIPSKAEAVLYDDNSVILTTTPGVESIPPVVEKGTWAASNGAIVITIPVEDGDDRTFTLAETNGVLTFTYSMTISMGANSMSFEIEMSSSTDIAMQLAGELVVNPASGTTATTKVIMYGSLASGGGDIVVVTNLGGTGYILSTVVEIGEWTLNQDYTMTITIGDKTFTNAPVPEAAQGTYAFDYTVTLSLGTNSMPATITVTRVMPTAQA